MEWRVSAQQHVEHARQMLEQWRYHYLALFGIIFVEEAGVPLPIPGDVFIAAMGVLASRGHASFPLVVAVVTGATVAGAALLFLLSRHAGRRILAWAGRWLGHSAAKEAKLQGWLHRNGFVAVVVGRLIPGLRIVMTVVAGALRLPRSTFTIGTVVAGVVWSSLYFWIGYLADSGYQRLAGEGARPSWLAIGAVALLVVALVVGWRLRRRAPPSPGPPAQP
jgi:membrane protein DedA with SNARE-associated domain